MSRPKPFIGTLGQNYLDRGLAAEGIRLSIITPHERFETLVGGRADKRRKTL
ncbi:MAG: hypothetical protein ACOX1A_09330 [Saccharofermentanales bacterium]